MELVKFKEVNLEDPFFDSLIRKKMIVLCRLFFILR